ncbi:phage tail protein [Kluyvera cryocrescens]|uniref:phage tail protein n=1 Tax=Kluyvera cryocrescens TaxID=580 RepID=UPI00224AE877|nr:phage tail protein [Kluyvera cryocrescens]MCX2866014.1 phage tail protein [Kluyvera cryocrescens]
MTTKYFATLTNQGAARLANATALGTKLNITQMGVGDANGTLPTPSPTQTTLINQRRIAAINSLAVDGNDAGQIIVEQVIPENEGGFWIREIGLYDDTDVLIAVANCPETYKPLLTEGSGRTQTIRMILVVSSSASITLKVDPSVVLATRKYVDEGVIEVKSYIDKQVKAHEAKANPHSQYLLIKNALKEIADAGLADEVLENLGLKKSTIGEAPIGIPFFWSNAKMPNEIIPQWSDHVYLKWNAATFDPELFPILALIHPDCVLADVRGDFIRVNDDGRGVDTGRELLSHQDSAAPNITGAVPATHYSIISSGGTGAIVSGIGSVSNDADKFNATGRSGFNIDASRCWEGYRDDVTEVRPGNTAMNFLVRAA